MRLKGGYRFNLQFRMTSEEEIAAGELLEKAKHSKSTLVVAALTEYMNNHPELNRETVVRLETYVPKMSELEQLVRTLIQEYLEKQNPSPALPKNTEIEERVSSDINEQSLAIKRLRELMKGER